MTKQQKTSIVVATAMAAGMLNEKKYDSENMKLLGLLPVLFLLLCSPGCTIYVPEHNAGLEGCDKDFTSLVGPPGSKMPIQRGSDKFDITRRLGLPVESNEHFYLPDGVGEFARSFGNGRRFLYPYVTVKAYRWPEMHPLLTASAQYRARYLLLWFDESDRLLDYVILARPYFDGDDRVVDNLIAFRSGTLAPGTQLK